MAVIEVLAGGPIAAAARRFRFQGRFGVSIIAKATFAFAANAPMPVATPERIVAAEIHDGGDPRKSIRRAIDLAPRLARADVVFVGRAYAPRNMPIERLQARLRIVRGDGAALIDKRLVVIGDRMIDGEGRGSAVLPFLSMPMTYERAHGGLGNATNPVGTGARRDPGTKLPNLVHPDDLDPRARVEPAGFAPIPSIWAARKKLVDAAIRKQLAEPIIDLGDAIDWSFFQAAPIDQRCDFLRGDEWIVLDHLHATIPEFKTRLPAAKARAQATIEGKTGMVNLDLDTLVIDGDAERCSAVWRGSFFVASEASLEGARIVAVLEAGGRIVEAAAIVEEKPSVVTIGPPGNGDHAGTVALDVDGDGRMAALAGEKLEGTITLDVQSRPPPSLSPFKISTSGATEAAARPTTSATPWGEQKPARAPLPSSPFEGTIALEEPEIAAPAPAKEKPPAAPVPERPAPSVKEGGAVVTTVASPSKRDDDRDDNAIAPPPKPPKPEVPAPPSELKKDLYGRFKR